MTWYWNRKELRSDELFHPILAKYENRRDREEKCILRKEGKDETYIREYIRSSKEKRLKTKKREWIEKFQKRNEEHIILLRQLGKTEEYLAMMMEKMKQNDEKKWGKMLKI